MKAVLIGLAVLVGALQIKLWFGAGGVPEVWRLSGAVDEQRAMNLALTDRNRGLAAEVQDLRVGYTAIEERARAELGMIRKNETFFHVVER
jgi:cell division protein FtsB